MKFWRVVSPSSTMIIRLRFRLTRVSHEQQSLDCWRRGRKRWLAIYVAPMAEDFTSTSSATFRPPKMCGAKIIRKPKMKDKFFFSHLIRFRNYFLLNEKCFWRQQHWQRERNREKTLQTILMSKKVCSSLKTITSSFHSFYITPLLKLLPASPLRSTLTPFWWPCRSEPLKLLKSPEGDFRNRSAGPQTLMVPSSDVETRTRG